VGEGQVVVGGWRWGVGEKAGRGGDHQTVMMPLQPTCTLGWYVECTETNFGDF
jgi:hypothetical protein